MRADVWAPFAQQLHCRTGGEDVPMMRGDDGWWQGPALADGDGLRVSGRRTGAFP